MSLGAALLASTANHCILFLGRKPQAVESSLTQPISITAVLQSPHISSSIVWFQLTAVRYRYFDKLLI